MPSACFEWTRLDHVLCRAQARCCITPPISRWRRPPGGRHLAARPATLPTPGCAIEGSPWWRSADAERGRCARSSDRAARASSFRSTTGTSSRMSCWPAARSSSMSTMDLAQDYRGIAEVCIFAAAVPRGTLATGPHFSDCCPVKGRFRPHRGADRVSRSDPRTASAMCCNARSPSAGGYSNRTYAASRRTPMRRRFSRPLRRRWLQGHRRAVRRLRARAPGEGLRRLGRYAGFFPRLRSLLESGASTQ